MFHDAMSYPDIMEAVGKKIRNNPEVTLTSKEEQAILESCLRSPFIEEMCRQYPEKSCEAILKPILTDKIEEYRAIRIAAMHPVTQGAAQNVNLASVAKSKQGVHGINYGNIKDYFNTLDNDYANLPKKLAIDFIGFIEKNSVFENTAVKTILLAEENQRLHERVRLMEEARKENKRVPKLKETADDYDTICTGFQKFLRYLESDVLCNSSVSYVKKPLGVLWSLFNKMDGDIKSNQEKLDMLCNIMAALDSGRTAYHANEGKYLDATDISCLAGLDERLYGDFCHLIPAQNNTDRNIISSLIPEIIKPFFEQNFDEHGRKKPHPAVYAEYYRAAGYFQLKEEKEIFQLKKDIDREHLKTEYLEHCSKIQSQTNQKLLTIKFDQMMNGFNAAKYPANETAQFVTWLKEKDQLDVIRVQNITDKSIERTVDEILNAFAKSDLFLDRSYALIIYQILKKELTEAIDNGVSVEHHKSIELFSPKVIVEKSYRNYLYQLKGLPEQGAQKYYDFKVSGLDAIIEKWIADELWNDQNPYAHIPCVESIFSDWLKKNKHTIKSDETKKSLLTYCLSKNYLRSAKTLIDGVNSNTLAGTWLKSLPIESWMPFIESGDRDLIDWLFNNYMDLLFSEERTIFMCVAEKCKKDVLRTLLNKFSNNLAVCSQSDRQGRTPLYYAAMSGNQDTVEFLLGLREGNHSLFNNYDVIRKLWNGLQTFPLSSDIKLLLELHHDGITPDNITILEPKHKQMLQEKGEAFVFKAIDSNQVDVLNGLIKNDCAPKTSKSLLYAIEKKNYDAIRVLANSEIINHRGSDGNMPLHYAVSRNDDNAVKILLSVPQIDCSLKNKAYQSALSIACQYCADTPQERRKNTTIIHALISGNNRSPVTIESVLEIIKNALTKENTDLMYAALKIYEDSLLNQSAMMEKSLQRIITHPTYKDCNDLSILKVYRYGLQRSLGVTPETGEINLTHGVRSEFLHIAVQYKLNVFLNALLDLDVNPNFQDAQGNTALMHAVFRNATDMVKSIGSRNTIDFFVKNKKNETVLDCAIITEKDEIIQLICSSLRAANVSLSLSDETHRSILDSAFNKKIDVLSEILSCFPEIDEEKFTAIIQGMQVGLPLEKILNGDVSSKDREQHSVNEYTLISATGDGYCGINSVNQFYYLMALYQPERLRSELFTETKFLSYLKKGLELDRTLIPKNDKKAFVDSLEQIKTGSDFKRFLETYYPCNSGRSLQKIERLLRLPALGVCCDLYRIFLETAHDDNLLNESSENEEYQKIAKLFGTDPDFLKNQKELFLYGEGLTLELDQNVVYGLQSDRNKDSLLKNQRIYQDRKNNKVNVDAYDIQKNQDLLDNAMTHNQSLPKIIESARYYNVTELMLLSAAFFKIERVQGDGGGVDYWMPLSPQSSPVAVKEINTHPPLGYLQNPSGGHWDFNIQQGIAKQIPHLTTQFENRASPSSTSSTKKRIYYNKSLDTTSAPHYNLQQNTAPLPLVMKIIGLVFAALLLVAVGYAGFVILRTITPMLYHAAISSISYGVQGAQNASFFVRQTIPKERVVSLAKSGYDIVKTYIPVISNGLHFAYHSLIKNLPTFVAVGAVSQKRKNI